MRLHHVVTPLIGLTLLAAASTNGSEGPQRAGRGRMQPQTMHSSAFAALQPVGEAEGWGRVAVHDAELPSGPMRTVQLWLFGMEPGLEYTLVIDGLAIGTVRSRPSGSAVLKLQEPGRGHDPVPENLPPAALLVSAVVYGPELAPTLEGTFTSFTRPPGPSIYEEQIALVDVTGGDSAGMAKVEMQEGGHQEFKTHATGLVPGEIYTVIVDGISLASLTADAQGQARLQLESPDDDNPLPDELLPVSEIVTVEWHGPGGLLLQGSFSGLGDCDTFLGTVMATTEGGLTLETDSQTIEVSTTVETSWLDFGDHELAVGDRVRVEGCWDSDVLVADVIELKNPDRDDACGSVVGPVGEIVEGGFTVEHGARTVAVLTTADTEWEGFVDHLLAVGDRVKVDGCWDGETFLARRVELKRTAKLRSAH